MNITLNDGTNIHIYRCEHPKRTRRICPHHNQLEYGELQEFYDTRRIFFDCGTFADYGYGFYEPPKKYKRLTFYWDSTLKTYTLTCAYVTSLFRHTNRNTILRIAKERLKPNGTIKEWNGKTGKSTIIIGGSSNT